jgi:hypothetical protein
MIDNNFYSKIEETVREVIFELRNNGINTECSCHHEGYIQCQCLDPTEELDIIYNVMHELKIKKWKAELTAECNPIYYHKYWWITSDSFKTVN